MSQQQNQVFQNDLRSEAYREYDFGGRVYRIDDPKTLYTRVGGTMHRVLDEKGVVHCVPSPGHGGCALRWKPRDPHQARHLLTDLAGRRGSRASATRE